MRSEWRLHHLEEAVQLCEVNPAAMSIGRRCPLELAHEPGEETLDVHHAHPSTGAVPPAGAEGHHPDLLRPGHRADALRLTVGEEPLRPELVGVRPVLPVPRHVPYKKMHPRPPAAAHCRHRRCSAAGHRRRTLRVRVGFAHEEGHRRVQAKRLEHDGVQVRQRAEPLLGHRAALAASISCYLAAQLLLDLRLGGEVSECPLDAGHDRLRAGAEELRQKAHHLVVRERAPGGVVVVVVLVVVGDTEVDESVNVRPDPAVVAAPRTAPAVPFRHEREEERGLLAAVGDEAPPLPPVQELGEP